MEITTALATAPTPDPKKQIGSYENKAFKVAQSFESFFMYQVLELMQPETDKDAIFSGGAGEEMFRHTLNEHTANAIAKQGGIGVADYIYKQLIQLNEVK